MRRDECLNSVTYTEEVIGGLSGKNIMESQTEVKYLTLIQ